MNFNDLGDYLLIGYLQEAADLSQTAGWNLESNVVTKDDQSSNGCV